MQKGIFKSFSHEHIFSQIVEQTLMIDVFEYESPFGILGSIVDKLFLKNYMTRLLEKRNETIKIFAESEQWRKVLNK